VQRLQRSSLLAISAERMWERATTPAGINAELRPVLRMTMPRGLSGVKIDEFPVGRTAGRSWILLGGVLPVDFDDLCLVEIEPPRRFLERSRTLTFSIWEHERLVEPDEDGCRVTDRLGFELRRGLRSVPGAARIARAIVGALFSHRHRRLRSAHGGN
jgi:ligand-binding SRPBCC domain-containing protein